MTEYVKGFVSDYLNMSGLELLVTWSDGNEYALRHVEDIWRKTSLGWNWDSLDGNGLSGKTITKVTDYIQDNGAYAIYEALL